jgi:prophage tail gpP-like protein
MRRPDTLTVELIEAPPNASAPPGAGSVFDRFTTAQIVNDISAPSEASFELGDDGSWTDLSKYVAHGAKYRVFINGLMRLTGRVELNDIPTDAKAGAVVRFTIRTKLQDAWYACADESVAVKGVNLKQFLIAVYKPLGFTESDFIFRASVARDLITGQSSTNQGKDVIDLEPIDLKEAKIKPPETIYAAADRHLRRHGFMHWDSPDGKIVVGAPNDAQLPTYFLACVRADRGIGNNILGATRSQDWSGIPSRLALYGSGSSKGASRSRISASLDDADVTAAGFYRPIIVMAEGIKTSGLADRAIARELSARSKSKDSFDIESDGLNWWSGTASIPWGIDTVAEIRSDVAGGSCGAYYIHRVISRRSASEGDVTNITLVKKGIWKL